MESLSQIATLPPVPEEEDDPDLGPPDDSPQEITQSEPETNIIIQAEVNTSQETTSPEHEPDADAGAGDIHSAPASSWTSSEGIWAATQMAAEA